MIVLPRIVQQTQRYTEKIKRLQAAMSPESMDAVVSEAAEIVFGWLKDATPIRYFGRLRAAWMRPLRLAEARYVIQNTMTVKTIVSGEVFVLDLLANGTGIYGPTGMPIVPVHAKLLFVPLNESASNGFRPGLRYGVDYYLAKSVRGLRSNQARRPVQTVRPRARKLLAQLMREKIRQAARPT